MMESSKHEFIQCRHTGHFWFKCRYCDQPIFGVPTVTVTYWNAVRQFCHAECKKAGERAEAIECQTIDADCNDCMHFQRGKVLAIGKDHGGSISGLCAKFQRSTVAHPKKWTGYECFEHRRQGKTAMTEETESVKPTEVDFKVLVEMMRLLEPVKPDMQLRMLCSLLVLCAPDDRVEAVSAIVGQLFREEV